MTNKKKIDEAVSLNVSTTDGTMSSSTTFNAADLSELAALLKYAGVQSASFEGPSSLTVTGDSVGGTASMSTTISSPDLRSIMNLLEPEFQALGDMEASMAEPELSDPGMGPDDFSPDKDQMDCPVDTTDMSTDDGSAIDAVVGPDGSLSIAEPDMDIADDELDSGIEEEAEYDYRTHDVHPTEYPGVSSKTIAQPSTKRVPARSSDNPLEEETVDEARDRSPAFIAAQKNLNGLKDGSVQAKDKADKATSKMGRELDKLANQKPKKLSSDQIWQRVEHEISMVIPDGDPMDALWPWAAKNGLDIDDLDKAARKNGFESVWNYYETMIQQLKDDGILENLDEAADEDLLNAAKAAKEDSKNGYVQHIDALPGGGYKISDWMSDKTVLSYSNGRCIGGEDPLEGLADMPANPDGEYNDDSHDFIPNKSFKDYFKEASKQRVFTPTPKAPGHSADELSSQFREGELDEAGKTDWEAKSRQYGEPYYLNTDCGYASLESIMNGEGYFDNNSGFTVLEIDRNGKSGYNYVTSHDKLAPGTKVTCITQTSTGQKFRPGKYITSFTGEQVSQDPQGVAAELAKIGISPNKKLPVKTFD